MKKTRRKALELSVESIRTLTLAKLQYAVGGDLTTTASDHYTYYCR